MSLLLDEVGGFRHFVKGHVHIPHHVHQNPPCAFHRAIAQEGAPDGLLRRFQSTVFSRGRSCAHHGFPLVLHHSADIGKVEVDNAIPGDQVGHALNALPQHIVCQAEGFQHRGMLVDQLQEIVVGNNNERVHILPEFLNPCNGSIASALAFVVERQGDDSYRQGLHLPSDLSNHRDTAGAGAASHACSHEHHVGSGNRLTDMVHALQRSTAADLRLGSGPQSLGAVRSQLKLGRSKGFLQIL